ncbi:hypothetical protein FOL47_001732 [Perkinsus chesapeaki]|uniref:Uncharacterized protein n=1 Tax=Perkinsus chesapeaki TaxID=330153 RepID=A0A7J6MI10_PERCH|nr:hypothetical protein FOL47_001732 [Perkinsus chesapeaki]
MPTSQIPSSEPKPAGDLGFQDELYSYPTYSGRPQMQLINVGYFSSRDISHCDTTYNISTCQGLPSTNTFRMPWRPLENCTGLETAEIEVTCELKCMVDPPARRYPAKICSLSFTHRNYSDLSIDFCRIERLEVNGFLVCTGQDERLQALYNSAISQREGESLRLWIVGIICVLSVFCLWRFIRYLVRRYEDSNDVDFSTLHEDVGTPPSQLAATPSPSVMGKSHRARKVISLYTIP